jgi:hypothetical protein
LTSVDRPFILPILRAITSLMEEIEAADWYNQRANECKNEELRAILAHNKDEEK